MEASWLIAVLLAAMASFISNLGVTLQKLHHLRSAADPRSHGADDYHRGWMWRVGLGLVFFGSLADFAALSFGPQSLVAPLGSLTLVSNVIFAPLLLRETIGHWDVLATVLIVVGSSVAVMFGSHESVTFTCVQLFSFFYRWDFILYAIIISIYGTVLYLFIQKIELIEKEEGVHSPRYLHYRGLHRFAYPSLSGTVGAQSVLFAKAFVSLLSNTVHHWSDSDEFTPGPLSSPAETSLLAVASLIGGNSTDGTTIVPPPPSTLAHQPSQNMFVYWQTFFVFSAMLGAIFAQIKYLNEGLKRFDASYEVPVFTAFWIVLSVLSGMIFYQEYTGMDTGQCLFFAFGVMVTVTGVITLGGREQTHHGSGVGGHQQLPQDDLDEDEPSLNGIGGSGDSSEPSASPSVGQDGSLNPGSLDGLRGHTNGRGIVVHASSSSSHHASSSSNHHRDAYRADHGDHDPEQDLEADLSDVHVGGAVIISPNSLQHSSSHSTNQPHVHHVNVRERSTPKDSQFDEPEGTVADGAKTAVLEASQRISQAFQKLRGKGGRGAQLVDSQAERDAINNINSAITGVSSSSSGPSSSSRPRGLSEDPPGDESDLGSEVTDEDLAAHEDPLILKGKAKARKSPSHAHQQQQHQQQSLNGSYTSDQTIMWYDQGGASSRSGSGSSNSGSPATHSHSLPVTPMPSIHVAPPPPHMRQSSLTPTASSLYDPTPSLHPGASSTTFYPGSRKRSDPGYRGGGGQGGHKDRRA